MGAEGSSLLSLVSIRPHCIFGWPLLDEIFAVFVGVRLPCADYANCVVQNAFYKGLNSSKMVTYIFVFNFNGEVVHAGIT